MEIPENKVSLDGDRPVGDRSRRIYIIYAAACIVVTLVPPVLWRLNLPIISYSYGARYLIFELFGFCMSLALVVITVLEVRRRGLSIERLFPLFMFFVVSFVYLILIVEISFRSSDYENYQFAVQALLDGQNPYYRTGYLYPPLMAQVMTLMYRLAVFTTTRAGLSLDQDSLLGIVFYFYQCAQFMLIVGAYLMSYHMVRRVGMKSVPASLLIAVLFLLNNPLMRTIRHCQPNMWLLDLILLALLALKAAPWVSGLAIALAAHIKMYPLIFVLPWLFLRCGRAIVWAGVGIVVIAFIQSNFGRSFEIWGQFFEFFSEFPKGIFFRDNSLYSVVYNTLRMAGANVDPKANIVSILGMLTSVGFVAYFTARFFKREKSYRKFAASASGAQEKDWAAICRTYGQVIDALALAMIVSPSVWEHHHVLALPVIIWAILTRARTRPLSVVIGTVLLIALPTFDIYPLSYHRLAGLLILVFSTPPTIVGKEETLVGTECSLDFKR